MKKLFFYCLILFCLIANEAFAQQPEFNTGKTDHFNITVGKAGNGYILIEINRNTGAKKTIKNGKAFEHGTNDVSFVFESDGVGFAYRMTGQGDDKQITYFKWIGRSDEYPDKAEFFHTEKVTPTTNSF